MKDQLALEESCYFLTVNHEPTLWLPGYTLNEDQEAFTAYLIDKNPLLLTENDPIDVLREANISGPSCYLNFAEISEVHSVMHEFPENSWHLKIGDKNEVRAYVNHIPRNILQEYKEHRIRSQQSAQHRC